MFSMHFKEIKGDTFNKLMPTLCPKGVNEVILIFKNEKYIKTAFHVVWCRINMILVRLIFFQDSPIFQFYL